MTILTINTILSALLPLLLFALMLNPLKVLAVKIRLVDTPNDRKLHKGSIPLIGGILIFISILITNLLLNTINNDLSWFLNYFVAGGLLLFIGVIDDRLDVRATVKLLIQLVLAAFAFYNGVRVESLNGVFGIYELPVIAQFFITVLGITGFINAFNLLDGVDGLASAYAFLTFAVFLILNSWIGNYHEALLHISICSALLIFLKFNLGSRIRKIFLGDAGSLFLGFSIVISGIQLMCNDSVATNSFNFSLVLCLLLVPLLDSIRVYLYRINRGRSPFKADRTHVHHLLVEAGVKPSHATIIIISYVLFMIIVSFLLVNFLNINLLLITFTLLFLMLIGFLNFNLKISTWQMHLRKIEKED